MFYNVVITCFVTERIVLHTEVLLYDKLNFFCAALLYVIKYSAHIIYEIMTELCERYFCRGR